MHRNLYDYNTDYPLPRPYLRLKTLKLNFPKITKNSCNQPYFHIMDMFQVL